jgi:hypothetical protein
MNSSNIDQGQLTELADRINSSHDAFQNAAAEAMTNALLCGELLIEARSKVAYGEWLPWLASHTKVGARQAQKLMQLARRAETLKANANPGSHLTINGALASLRRRPQQRKAISAGEEEVVKALSRDLKEVQCSGAAGRILQAVIAVFEIEVTPSQAAKQFVDPVERKEAARATDASIAWLRDFQRELEKPQDVKKPKLQLVASERPDEDSDPSVPSN